jgi:hypothetical protein
VAKIKKTIEVEGEFVVMADNDSLPIADGLNSEFEACVVALLCSMGAFKDRRVFIAFNAPDEELIANEERFWWNGNEYQVGDDLNDPADRLLWYAQYGYHAERGNPGEAWAPADPVTMNEVKKWLIRVASEHEVHQFLPDEAVQSVPVGSERSGDRYHVSLLRDIVRDPSYHKLDESVKRGVLETLVRLMQQSGRE